eukprot:611800_1
MALQVGCVSNGLCDIRLLSKEEDKRHYMCGQCHNLAINTKALICTNHEQDTTLYCGSCAIAIQSANQCPINQHQNPIFSDQHVAQARIKQNVEFICPYSAQFNRYHAPHHAPHHGAIQDTLEGKNQQDEARKCRWKGTYTQLQHHVMECRFKPRDTKSFIDLKRKVQTLESDNTGLNNEIFAMKRIIHDLRQSIDVLTNELSNKVNRDEMKEYIPPPQPPQPPQPVRHEAPHSSLMWIAGAVVAVMFAVLTLHISTLKAEWMNKIDQMNGTITTIRDECNDYSNGKIPSAAKGFDDAFHNISLSVNTINTSVDNMNATLNELNGSCAVSKNEWMDKIDQMNGTIATIRDECHDYTNRHISSTANGFDDALRIITLSINAHNTILNELNGSYAVLRGELNTTSGDYKGLKNKILALQMDKIDQLNTTSGDCSGLKKKMYELENLMQNHRFDEAAHKEPVVQIELKGRRHSNRKHWSGYPRNLLQDNDNCYWSADNKEFKANENDWIIFKLKQENTLYLPTKCMV